MCDVRSYVCTRVRRVALVSLWRVSVDRGVGLHVGGDLGPMGALERLGSYHASGALHSEVLLAESIPVQGEAPVAGGSLRRGLQAGGTQETLSCRTPRPRALMEASEGSHQRSLHTCGDGAGTVLGPAEMHTSSGVSLCVTRVCCGHTWVSSSTWNSDSIHGEKSWKGFRLPKPHDEGKAEVQGGRHGRLS